MGENERKSEEKNSKSKTILNICMMCSWEIERDYLLMRKVMKWEDEENDEDENNWWIIASNPCIKKIKRKVKKLLSYHAQY